jgi:signal transduction histidine kinase/DNA-binding response OmpR family regulator
MVSRNQDSSLVLIADDEMQTVVMLSRILEREGYRVCSAPDGKAALEAAQRLRPDLILLDFQMPGMNGFEVLQKLRENPLTANIPTIIVTAKARQPSDIARGLNLGADDFVQKPFDPGELMARARSKIRSRALEDALQRKSQELEILLRVGEAVNQQHISIANLLELVTYLVLDLLPGDVAAIHLINESSSLSLYHIQSKPQISIDNEIVFPESLKSFLVDPRPWLWSSPRQALFSQFQSGMAVPLQHGSEVLGILSLMSSDHAISYDDNHLRLFEGIGRQAALALRNAQLYEALANYASRLEEMVQEKTAELRSTQQMLIRAEKLASIGHLAASIAHEINNPLQPIRINLEDMLEDLQRGLAIDARAIKSTQDSVERIRRIVNQLLDFAGKRTQSGVDQQLIDAAQVIEGIVNLNRKFFEKEGMHLIAELDPPLLVYASKDQLEQVFMNLTLNAQAAMQREGTLIIRGRIEQQEVRIDFQDDGTGIPEDMINRIFDPFFSTKPNGTGLGLFVSYGIIQNHHGSIEVASQQGNGTTFTIRLPAHLT